MALQEKYDNPLSLLRQFNIDKKKIIQNDNEIVLGQYCWPKSVETSFFKKSAGKGGISKEYYTLECLVNFLRNADLPHPEYVKQAEAKGIPAVRRPDRKDLLKYLSGKTDSCDNIDLFAPSNPPRIKRDLEDSGVCPPGTEPKKLKVDEAQERNEHVEAKEEKSEDSGENLNGKDELSENTNNSTSSDIPV